MHDRLPESVSMPSTLLEPSALGAVLCLAPHPDDEVFGAGGLLARVAAAGLPVGVVVFTRGEAAAGKPDADLAALRWQESCRAAAVLGLPEPRSLHWPDRGLIYGEPLIAQVEALLQAHAPHTLLLPALGEPHPDHQALALAGLAAVMRGAPVEQVLTYEVGAPMQPNVRVDITQVAERKWAAVEAFASQLPLQAYGAQTRALATLRAFGLGSGCTAAEAFFQVSAAALRRQGPGAALPGWPQARLRHDAALAPAQVPQVTVLIRSMDRPLIADALASVAAQTWPHIEMVVLNASGRPHAPLPPAPPHLALRLVDPPAGPDGRLPVCERARAANLALQAARGEYALFLDDDDLLLPHHLARLVSALQAAPQAVAAYAGVRVDGADGVWVRDYDLPWASERLAGINVLPMHAVLFRLDRARAAGLQFDETLPVLEDWLFWRQLSALGPFVHCPGVSAVYRQGEGHSALADPEGPHHWRTWHRRILGRELADTPPEQTVHLLAWHAVALDRTQAALDAVQRREAEALAAVQAAQRQAAEAQAETRSAQVQAAAAQAAEEASRIDATAARTEADAARAEADAARTEADTARGQTEAARQAASALANELALLRGSRSWRLTRPLRALRALLGPPRG